MSMKAAIVNRFASIKEEQAGNVEVVDAARPELKQNSNQMLLRVLAAALNPGDCKVLTGEVAMFYKPKSFPYVMGFDVCGVVEATGSKCTRFKKGDVVIGCLEDMATGSMAEYVLCPEQAVTRAPKSMTPVQAASLSCAGATAMEAVKCAKLPPNSSVIILGASGGVGSLLVQLVRNAGATYIAATSTNEALVKSLGADEVINYRTDKWYEVLKGRNLDAVIDCAGGEDSWENAHLALARRGIYVAVTTDPEGTARNFGEFVSFMGPVLKRKLSPFTPRFSMVANFPSGDKLAPLVSLVDEGKVKAVLDPTSPYSFTTEDIRRAIQLQASHRAKGKLVVEISSLESSS